MNHHIVGRRSPLLSTLIILTALLSTSTYAIGNQDSSVVEIKESQASSITTVRTQAIDAVLSRYFNANAPGVTVIVTEHGKLMFRKAYGMANLEKGIALSPEMTMRVGSVTKQFTAAAIMLLSEEGRLAVSDDLRKYLPDYPTYGHKITIENLLTHTSGITNYTSLPRSPSLMASNVNVNDGINFFKDALPEFQPGEHFSYSNSNYFLLGAIIEKVSGMTYPEFMSERIFKPLGLTHTEIETPSTSISPPVVGYTKTWWRTEKAPYYSMSWPYAAGALRTNVDDLARWIQAVSDGKLLKSESWKRMTTGYILKGGKITGYGYGWFVGTQRGISFIGHGGDIGGFNADTLILPDEEVFIAVLKNSDSFGPSSQSLAMQIAATLKDRKNSALEQY